MVYLLRFIVLWRVLFFVGFCFSLSLCFCFSVCVCDIICVFLCSLVRFFLFCNYGVSCMASLISIDAFPPCIGRAWYHYGCYCSSLFANALRYNSISPRKCLLPCVFVVCFILCFNFLFSLWQIGALKPDHGGSIEASAGGPQPSRFLVRVK